ncbi:GtrA family protein [Sphingomonas rosea]|jgi:putative flippase GtrA|uniref:GtrA family protein n=1 Tax=Sphingomonas rosea TaxID=335605 RepID=A0ABP7TY96_9SPHN
MVIATLFPEPRHRKLLGQLVRFGLVGGGLAVLYSAIYWPLATYVMWPVFAVLIAFAVAVTTGYFLHSRWSFQDQGHAEDTRTKVGFLLVQSSGMVLNVLFTWLLVDVMHGPTWWPLVPAVTVTPLFTFILNRWWVFR